MKHKLFFSVLLAALLFMAPQMQSQNLILRLQSGSDQTIPLNTIQKITFTNSNVVLNFASGGTQSVGFTNLESMFFTSQSTAERVIKSSSNIFFNPKNNQLCFRNLSEGSYPIKIYRMDGVTVLSKTIINNESVDLNGLPNNFYLVRIDNQVLKFKK